MDDTKENIMPQQQQDKDETFGKEYNNSSDTVLSFSELLPKFGEAMFLVGRNSVLVGSKLCSRGVEAMFSWDRNYVPNVVML
jgi:hypothetical protein